MSDSGEGKPSAPARVTPLTLPLYLIGHRGSILALAASRWTVWIGAVFVLSAAFAREYDGEDLVTEPWHLLRPFGASIVTSLALFSLLWAACRARGAPVPFAAYATFLALYWMTAPLAWAYAVPYERFTDVLGAMKANLSTLAVVSVWRVLLITRVASVLLATRFLPTLAIVAAYACAVVIAVGLTAPMPVIDLMGGLRDTSPEGVLAEITLGVVVWSICLGPVLFALALGSLYWFKPRLPVPVGPPNARLPLGTALTALAALAVFLALATQTQDEQRLRRRTERLFAQGKIDEALALMSARVPTDYPPQWQPPPRVARLGIPAGLTAVWTAMTAQPPAPWVTSVYVDKTIELLRRRLYRRGWSETSEWPAWNAMFWQNQRLVAEENEDLIDPAPIRFLLRFDESVPAEERDRIRAALEPTPGG